MKAFEESLLFIICTGLLLCWLISFFLLDFCQIDIEVAINMDEESSVAGVV